MCYNSGQFICFQQKIKKYLTNSDFNIRFKHFINSGKHMTHHNLSNILIVAVVVVLVLRGTAARFL